MGGGSKPEEGRTDLTFPHVFGTLVSMLSRALPPVPYTATIPDTYC